MSKAKKPHPEPSYYLNATVLLTASVEDQAISVQSLLDLAAIATPSTRPSWLPVLDAAARIQRRLAIGEWNELGLYVGLLVEELGIQLSAIEARDLLTEVIARTRRDGAQLGFVALAHRLCVLEAM